MKKRSFLPIALFSAIFIAAAFMMQGFTPQTELPSNIPDSVWVVLENSCYDCHANSGPMFARGKLNFDEWNSYDDEKQLQKAKDMIREIQKGKMPPKKYLKNLPESALTEQEIQRLSNWVSQMEK